MYLYGFLNQSLGLKLGDISFFIKITICVPLSTPSKFESHLTNPLILNGFWKKAFVEADITTTLSRVVCFCLFYGA